MRFGDMADSISDRVDDPAEAGVEYYVGLEHLDPESLKIHRWGKPTDVEATKLRFKPGDIIFGRRRAYQRKLAVAAFEGICSAHALVLRAREEVVLPEFLPFFMQSDIFFERAMSISVGSLSPTINWKTLAQQEFALPPRDEQRRIAEVLWAADEAVETTKIVEQDIKRAIQAILSDEFGQRSSNEVVLEHICEPNGIQIGPFGSQLHASDYVFDGIPVIMPSDMMEGYIRTENIARVDTQTANRLSLHKVLANDILLPRRGDLQKRAYVDSEQEGWLCGTGSIRIRVRKNLPARAVFFALSTSKVNLWLADNAVGTTMPNLNSKIVSKIPLRLPEQHKMFALLDLIDKLNMISSQNKHKLNSTYLLKKSILKEVLSES